MIKSNQPSPKTKSKSTMKTNLLRVVFWLGLTFLFLHVMWSCGERERPEQEMLDYEMPAPLQSETVQESLGIVNEVMDTTDSLRYEVDDE